MGTISKVTAGGATHLIASSAYGICSTAAATAAKTVSFTDDQPFTLIQGETIHIRFTNTNTAANPTLNVKDTGNKPIHRIGGTVAGTTVANSWAAGEIVSLTYDTTQVSTGCWIINSGHKYTVATASIGSASKGTSIAADDITAYTAGTAANLTYTSRSIPNVTSVGSSTITNPSFSETDRDNGVSTTDYKMIMPYNIVTAVTVPTLGTAISADDITAWTTNTPTSVTYTARSIPNISVAPITVAVGVSAS